MIFKSGEPGGLFYVILKGQVGINILLPKANDRSQLEYR